MDEDLDGVPIKGKVFIHDGELYFTAHDVSFRGGNYAIYEISLNRIDGFPLSPRTSDLHVVWGCHVIDAKHLYFSFPINYPLSEFCTTKDGARWDVSSGNYVIEMHFHAVDDDGKISRFHVFREKFNIGLDGYLKNISE